MSWYPKDITKCPKCGKQFSTPIEQFNHRSNGCDFTRDTFPNGSIWMKHDRSEAGYVKASHPFGGFWIMNFKTGIHNQRCSGDGTQGVHRRGRKWHLDFVKDVGWRWI